MQLFKKKVTLKLVGLDGNAYNLLGAFKKNALKQGWTPQEIEKIITVATSSDYNHLLTTLIDNCEDIQGFDEDDDNENDLENDSE